LGAFAATPLVRSRAAQPIRTAVPRILVLGKAFLGVTRKSGVVKFKQKTSLHVCVLGQMYVLMDLACCSLTFAFVTEQQAQHGQC